MGIKVGEVPDEGGVSNEERTLGSQTWSFVRC